MILLFSGFQENYSGCCTVAARTLRLLHPHKVWDDRYLASCLEATYVSYALGELRELRQYGVLRTTGAKSSQGEI